MKKSYLIFLFSVFSNGIFADFFLEEMKLNFKKLQEQEIIILKNKKIKEAESLYLKKAKEENDRFVGLCVLYKIYCNDLNRLNKERKDLHKKILGGKEDINMIDEKLRKPGSSEERPLLLIEKDSIERQISNCSSAADSLSNRFEDVDRMLAQTKEKMQQILQYKRENIRVLKEH